MRKAKEKSFAFCFLWFDLLVICKLITSENMEFVPMSGDMYKFTEREL